MGRPQRWSLQRCQSRLRRTRRRELPHTRCCQTWPLRLSRAAACLMLNQMHSLQVKVALLHRHFRDSRYTQSEVGVSTSREGVCSQLHSVDVTKLHSAHQPCRTPCQRRLSATRRRQLAGFISPPPTESCWSLAPDVYATPSHVLSTSRQRQSGSPRQQGSPRNTSWWVHLARDCAVRRASASWWSISPASSGSDISPAQVVFCDASSCVEHITPAPVVYVAQNLVDIFFPCRQYTPPAPIGVFRRLASDSLPWSIQLRHVGHTGTCFSNSQGGTFSSRHSAAAREELLWYLG